MCIVLRIYTVTKPPHCMRDSNLVIGPNINPLRQKYLTFVIDTCVSLLSRYVSDRLPARGAWCAFMIYLPFATDTSTFFLYYIPAFASNNMTSYHLKRFSFLPIYSQGEGL